MNLEFKQLININESICRKESVKQNYKIIN